MKNDTAPPWLTDFITEAKWQFAKTMPEVPHWYTLRKWNDDMIFNMAVQIIRIQGKQERWGPYNNTYLVVGDWKYWTMGAPVLETTVLNREKHPDPNA